MSERHVLFRADASVAIGVGHVTRCLTLARELGNHGWTSIFVTRREYAEFVTRIVCPDAMVFLIDVETHHDDALATCAVAEARRVSWIVVDHLELGADWESRVRSADRHTMAIDDLRQRAHCTDVCVGDSDMPFPEAQNDCDAARLELSGPAYALIDAQFAAAALENPDGGWRVLVSYGGSDPTSETEKALAAIALVHDVSTLDVTVVIGQANTRAASIRESASRISARVVESPQSIAPLLRHAHLFLCAGGQTMTEALAMRRHALVTTTADNQVIGVRRATELGLIGNLGHHSSVTSDTIRCGIENSFDNHVVMMEALTRSPFDTHGAARIAALMRTNAPADDLTVSA